MSISISIMQRGYLLTLLTTVMLLPGLDAWSGRPTPGVQYIHTNHIGSTSLTTDEVGRVHTRMIYRPYGEQDAALSENPEDTRVGFTGKELDDDTGLNYYGGRYYDAFLGRFTRRDPGPGAADNHPAAWNRYAYGGGNPITVTDPSGYTLDPFGFDGEEPDPNPPPSGDIPAVYYTGDNMGEAPAPVGVAEDNDGVVSQDNLTWPNLICEPETCDLIPLILPNTPVNIITDPMTLHELDAYIQNLMYSTGGNSGSVSITDFVTYNEDGTVTINFLPASFSVADGWGFGFGVFFNTTFDNGDLVDFQFGSFIESLLGFEVDISGFGLGAVESYQDQYSLIHVENDGQNAHVYLFERRRILSRTFTTGPVSHSTTLGEEVLQSIDMGSRPVD